MGRKMRRRLRKAGERMQSGIGGQQQPQRPPTKSPNYGGKSGGTVFKPPGGPGTPTPPPKYGSGGGGVMRPTM